MVVSGEYHHNGENAVNKARQNTESDKRVHVRRAMEQILKSALDDIEAVNEERYRQNKQRRSKSLVMGVHCKKRNFRQAYH